MNAPPTQYPRTPSFGVGYFARMGAVCVHVPGFAVGTGRSRTVTKFPVVTTVVLTDRTVPTNAMVLPSRDLRGRHDQLGCGVELPDDLPLCPCLGRRERERREAEPLGQIERRLRFLLRLLVPNRPLHRH